MADIDGDGNPDIVAAQEAVSTTEEKSSIAVYLGDGRGGFATPLSFPCTGGLPQPFQALLMGDLNHDTKLDIIVTRPDGWQVFLNTCP